MNEGGAPVTKQDVVSYFKAFLDREPENEGVVSLFTGCENRTRLAEALGRSREFSLRTGLKLGSDFDHISGIYELLYGSSLTAGELHRLQAYGVTDGLISSQVVRRIIAATDRQDRSTPYLVRFGASDVVYVRLDGFELAIDVADVAVGTIIMKDKAYEPHLTSFFQRSIKPGMTVFDVGGNIGYFSMLAASLVGPNGRVISVEPNSENARLILLSAERNRFRNVNLVPVALSTKTGSAFFSSHMGSNGGLLPSTEDVLLDPQCVVVPTIRLDDLAPERVDFIKVDTEGAEGLVLDGASSVIDRDRPIISAEFSPPMLLRVSGVQPSEFLQSFRRRGYRIAELDRTAGSGEETDIEDVDEFMRSYGDASRISDLIFKP